MHSPTISPFPGNPTVSPPGSGSSTSPVTPLSGQTSAAPASNVFTRLFSVKSSDQKTIEAYLGISIEPPSGTYARDISAVHQLIANEITSGSITKSTTLSSDLETLETKIRAPQTPITPDAAKAFTQIATAMIQKAFFTTDHGQPIKDSSGKPITIICDNFAELTQKVAEYLNKNPSLPSNVRSDLASAACIGFKSINPITPSATPLAADIDTVHNAMLLDLQEQNREILKSIGVTPGTAKKPDQMPIFTDKEIQDLLTQAGGMIQATTQKMDSAQTQTDIANFISLEIKKRRALFSSNVTDFFDQANQDCETKMSAAGLSDSTKKDLLKKFQEKLIEKYISSLAATAATPATAATATPAIPGTSREVEAEVKALYEASLYEISSSRSRIIVGSGQASVAASPDENKLRQALIANHIENATYASLTVDKVQFHSQTVKSGVALSTTAQAAPTIVAEYNKGSKTVSFNNGFKEPANEKATIEAINTALALEGIGSGTLTKKSDGTLNGTIAIKFLSDDLAIINLAAQALLKLMKENPDLTIAHLPETQAGAKLRQALEAAIKEEIKTATAAAAPVAATAAVPGAATAVPGAATAAAAAPHPFGGKSIVDIMQRVAPVATAVAKVAAAPASQTTKQTATGSAPFAALAGAAPGQVSQQVGGMHHTRGRQRSNSLTPPSHK